MSAETKTYRLEKKVPFPDRYNVFDCHGEMVVEISGRRRKEINKWLQAQGATAIVKR